MCLGDLVLTVVVLARTEYMYSTLHKKLCERNATGSRPFESMLSRLAHEGAHEAMVRVQFATLFVKAHLANAQEASRDLANGREHYVHDSFSNTS